MESIQNILIIEDNLSFAIELEMNLSKWGYENVVNIDNSAEALEYIFTKSPDLILMDINIKGSLNGVQIAQKITTLNIPIIYMTGQRDEQFYADAKNTNAVSYLIKPFDELSLRGAIEFALPKKSNSKSVEIERVEEDYFFVRKKNSLSKINTKDITHISSAGNYCDIFYKDTKNTLKISLVRLMNQINDDHLIQIHKSYVIRLNKIDEIVLSKNEVKIGEYSVPIGRRYKKEFLERMKIM